MFRVVVFLAASLIFCGCVTRTAFDELQEQHNEIVSERDDLANRVTHLEIERNSFETQYLDAQESFEDERLTRTALASNLAEVEIKATRLDRDLEAERLARVAAATTTSAA